MSLPQGTAPSATGTGVCLERRPPGAMPGGLLRFLITHSHDVRKKITFLLTHFHLESSTALRSHSNPIIRRAAVHPIITVLHTQNGQELPIPLYAVPGIKQPAGHSTDCQGPGDSQGWRGGIASASAEHWQHNKWQYVILFVFNLQREGKALKTLSWALRFGVVLTRPCSSWLTPAQWQFFLQSGIATVSRYHGFLSGQGQAWAQVIFSRWVLF